jgi:hypothetical protein
MLIRHGVVNSQQCNDGEDDCPYGSDPDTDIVSTMQSPVIVGNVTLGGSELFSVIDTLPFADRKYTTFGLIQKTLGAMSLAPNGFKAVIFLFDGRITEETITVFRLFRSMFPGCEKNLLIVKNRERRFDNTIVYENNLKALQNDFVDFQDAMSKGAQFVVIDSNSFLPNHFLKSYLLLSRLITSTENVYSGTFHTIVKSLEDGFTLNTVWSSIKVLCAHFCTKNNDEKCICILSRMLNYLGIRYILLGFSATVFILVVPQVIIFTLFFVTYYMTWKKPPSWRVYHNKKR